MARYAGAKAQSRPKQTALLLISNYTLSFPAGLI